MAANRTIFVHYGPEGAEKPVKLKLVLPPSKTVKAVAKAFAKAVAKSRPDLAPIDVGTCAVVRAGGARVDFDATVGDVFAENEEAFVVAPRPQPAAPCPGDGRPAAAAPRGNGTPPGAWLRVAGKGALVRAGPAKDAAQVGAPLKRGAEAWGESVEWLADGTPRVRLAWPVAGWATLNVFEPFRVPDRARVALTPLEIGCEPDDPGDWWAAMKFVSCLNAMPRLPTAMEGDRAEWLERGDVALQAGYLADAVGRYSRAIVCAFRRFFGVEETFFRELSRRNGRGLEGGPSAGDQHVGKLASPDDYCVLYAMRALAFWRARDELPEADRDATLFGVACLCSAGRDVAFACQHASKKKVEDWLGADVVGAIAAASKRKPVVAPDHAQADAKVPFGGVRVGKPDA